MAPFSIDKDEAYTNEDLDHEPESIHSRLVNPFIGKNAEEMHALVNEFMHKTEIDTIFEETIRKGAFLAQDSKAFQNPRDDGLELNDAERKALRLEDPTHGRAAVQGWDETAVNGAQIFYVQAFGINGTNNAGLVGLVNAAPYLCCAVIGCWLTYPLNKYLGRRGTIFLTCMISSATCIWQAFTSTWWHLFIARFCLGLGIGPKSATIPIYTAESVPANIRGALTMQWQMWTAFGIMLGYVAGVVFHDVLQGDDPSKCGSGQSQQTLLSFECSLNWRLMLASPMVLPFVAAAYVFTLPESPRWLLLKGREGDKKKYLKAFEALMTLRHNRIQAARDLFLIHHLLDGEEIVKSQIGNKFFELWTKPRNRRALVASLIVMFLQQICGVNVMAFYSSAVLQGVLGDKNALLGSMGFGILNWLFALPAVYTIDTFGRRFLLLLTFPFLALFQLLTAMAFLLPNKSNGQTALVLTGMYLFSICYSPGEGPVPFVYSAESMPLYVRDLGMSMATATLWVFNFFLAVTFPRFRVAFTNTGAFGWYAAWCVIGWFMILLFVPETKGLTLEALDARFSISTRSHARWAISDVYWAFSDPNCGAAYNDAIGDFTLGAIKGCGQANPSSPIALPVKQPVCLHPPIMRLALRFSLLTAVLLAIVYLVLKAPIDDRLDQYGVGSYIKHKVFTSAKGAALNYLPPLPGTTGDKIIVMARLEADDTGWVTEELADWQSAVYTVNPSTEDSDTLRTPANKGREAMAYLTYIIDHYSDLPAIVAFLHSHRDGFFSSWHTDTPLHNNVDAMRTLNLSFVKQNGYVNLRCKRSPGCLEVQTHNAHVTPEVYLEVFQGTSTQINETTQAPELVGAACCAQFAASSEQIRKRPLADYEVLRRWLLQTSDKDAKSGRVMEFLWHIIFGKEAV
uniref:Hypothetical polyol transporter n=1 Tax=Ramalina conduplicans TaxID=372067 RepID=A0A5A4RGL5_9LECA|nr:hypothetical polyol transporter [Ramalina conduplicans]